MSTIKFTVEDSKAAEILKVIMNSGIAVTYVELTGDQRPQTRKYSTPSVNQSREVDTPTFTFVPDAEIVGGTIFYIDDKADGVYEFYDVYGNVIKNVQVGDRPYYYKVISPGSKDKYYVYHDEIYKGLTWTYAGDCEYDAYKAAGTAACMYSGKTNTDRVMTRSNKTCLIAVPNKSPTIWHQLQQMNDARVGGCNDWFIPSIFEMEKLMLAVQSGNVTGGTVAGSSYGDSVFATKYIWSSTEAASYHGNFSVWMWDAGYQCVYISPKNREFAMLIARAF